MRQYTKLYTPNYTFGYTVNQVNNVYLLKDKLIHICINFHLYDNIIDIYCL